MTQRENPTPGQTYQSDQEETEDEEVKRNCIMGESGIRDSDFSDSYSDMEESESKLSIDDENNAMLDVGWKEERMGDLVKFVSVGSPIVKPKGLILYCPKPTMPNLASETEKPERNGEASRNVLEMKCALSITSMNKNSKLFHKSNGDSDVEHSASDIIGSSSVCSSDSDKNNNTGGNESAESDTDMKATSFDFQFVEREDLSMQVEEAIIISSQNSDEGYCESSLDDQQELQEIMTREYALVGASVDDKWFAGNQKRVLSSNELSALNQEAQCDIDFRKRMRLSRQTSKEVSAIPEITLGIEALDQIIQPLPRQYLIRDDSLLVSSSCDDKDDIMLREELKEKFQESCPCCARANLLIPLLTPPQSPRTVDKAFEEQVITPVEWPSNLVMDSAIMKAFTNVLPVSTNNNRDGEVKNDASKFHSFDESSKNRLPPRLRTISVETP